MESEESNGKKKGRPRLPDDNPVSVREYWRKHSAHKKEQSEVDRLLHGTFDVESQRSYLPRGVG